MRLLLFLLVALPLFGQGLIVNPYRFVVAGGGIVEDAVGSGSGADPSIMHTQGALTSGYALVFAEYAFSAATSAATATYDGNAMTEIATFSQASFYHMKIFYRDLGTAGSGTKTVAVAHTDAVGSAFTTVITFSGVKQGGGFTVGPAGTAGAFEDPMTFSIATTSASEWIYGGCLSNRPLAANVTPNGTQINENDADGITYNNQKLAGTGGSVTVSWDLDASTHGVRGAVVLQPAP